jgi:chlorobactene glucosyltransferase
MNIILLVINGILGLFLLITLINVFGGPRLSRPPGKPHPIKRKISVLVPARDEEQNLPSCLKSLLTLDPAPAEIFILDDHSTDQTPRIIRKYAERHPHIHYLKGKPLPEGWLGKPWACHQLSQAATGDILVFTDADNTHEQSVLEKTCRWMTVLNLDMLSAQPQQRLHSMAEKMVIPVIDMFAYSMLPLRLTRFSKYPSLAAANGQWIVFKKEAYFKMGGHQSVAGNVIEDVMLSRNAKKMGLRILLTAGTHAIYGRMYRNAEEVRKGFAKNLFGLTGFHSGLFFLIFSMLLLTMVFPYGIIFFVSGPAAGIAIGLNVIIRLLLVLAYRHPPFTSLVLHPFTILYTARIALLSWHGYHNGNIVWKGRSLFNKGKS